MDNNIIYKIIIHFDQETQFRFSIYKQNKLKSFYNKENLNKDENDILNKEIKKYNKKILNKDYKENNNKIITKTNKIITKTNKIITNKIIKALNSYEIRIIKFQNLKEKLAKKFSKRLTIDDLKEKNILKRPIDFEKIHKKLETIFNKSNILVDHNNINFNNKYIFKYIFKDDLFCFDIDPRHFKVAVFLDFEFKRRILEEKLKFNGNKNN
ncbi:hypothetical protein DMUE_3678 [Dictyocoela muelleri]|nr:hypothetical protein DMUE_3678 [Dictyocoela muelleri]